jgi:hypothetical protein
VLTATEPVSFMSGEPVQALIVDDAGRVVGHAGMMVGWGRDIALQPGESTRLQLHASTMSASPARLPVLPAGEWSMVVPLEHTDFATRRNLELVAGPFTVRLTE